MADRKFSNQNLAGILSEALGLESGQGRSQFSGIYRETFRKALDHPSAPATFAELLCILEEMEGDKFAVDAVREVAQSDPERSVHGFANEYVREGPASD